MGEILFLSHRIPFPPDRGDKIRSHNVLKALAQLAPVHVATFVDDDHDLASERDLAELAATHILRRRDKHLAVAAVEALTRGSALSLTAFRDRRLQVWIKETLRRRPIEAIYVFSGQMAQYIPEDFEGRVIADLVDVDSAKFEAYAAKSRGLRSWMERREARLLGAEEARIAARANATLLISSAEAQLLNSRMPAPIAQAGTVHAMGNGIDSAFFDPSQVEPEARMKRVGDLRIIFTGQMDYAPNVEAVIRTIERIMPAVRSVRPDASFHVVGRNPGPELRVRDRMDGIHVWGRVDDIRPWLAAADLALVPLDVARGVQNKVLEAMAMALPVVLTPGAATGIDALPGCDFLIAESDAALADALCSLAHDKARALAMGAAARRWIEANAAWESALAMLPEYVRPGFSKLRQCDLTCA
ncbi:MAG TPA: TIGR03087 family PEP-CTERM/XrtA system glycosyltransferase [Novosphingobium sp.]|nr:TIGR03087 family PEP-CTERM/XrtA system glycosyltransferase [Novosphingobium sp.]